MVLKTILILFAVGLNGLELFFPRIPFLPWFKPGLANTITIIWLIRYGLTDTLLFTVLRSWISGFYFGFSLLTLTLSLSGGLLSTVAMSIAWNMLGKKGALGTVGLGVLGALVHNSGQLLTVYFMLTSNSSIFYQIPFMMAAALIFGSITGFLVPTIAAITTGNINIAITSKELTNQQPATTANIVKSIIVIAMCCVLFTINNSVYLAIFATIFTFAAIFLSEQKKHALLYPLRFKYLLLFVALTYLFFSPGKRLTFVPFLTDEGVQSAVIQVLRIWCWIEAGLILQAFQFNAILFRFLTRLFPNHQSTLSAGVLALEHFPEILSLQKQEKLDWKYLFSRPVSFLKNYFTVLYERILGVVVGD